MAYLVANMAKYKENDLSAVGAESFRTLKRYKNKVDRTKSSQNIEYRKDGMTDNYKIAVNRDIINRWTQKKSMRSDNVKIVGLVVSASPEVFNDLSDEERTEKATKFYEDSSEYLKGRFGEENLFSATLHMDETTPHIHFGIIPMLDGQLNAKKMFNRQGLRDLHDAKGKDGFITFMNERGWDLETEPKDTSAKHVDPDKYNAAQEELKGIADETKKQKRVLAGMQKKATTLYEDSEREGFEKGYSKGKREGGDKVKKELEGRESRLNELEGHLEDKSEFLVVDATNKVLKDFESREEEIERKEKALLEEKAKVQANEIAMYDKFDEQKERFDEVLKSIDLAPNLRKGLINYVTYGETNLKFKTKEPVPVPVAKVIERIDVEKVKKRVIKQVHEEDGPEM